MDDVNAEIEPNELDLRELILNLKEPCVIKNMNYTWDCFNKNFEDWTNIYDENAGKVSFETSCRKHSSSPQWEKYRSTRKMKASEILETESNEFLKTNWVTYSYKNLEELPNGCWKGIDFTTLGFRSITTDINFWLSSEGAHTPAHYDTYGCNIVVQVYGKKMWLLFPPTAKFTPTRIPYEESSVYCTETFYSPKDLSQFSKIEEDCHKVVLEPGDTLIVPRHWWHYVENLTPALSVNAWVPLDVDRESHIEECIVKFLFEHFAKSGSTTEERVEILNPNEVANLEEDSDVLEILEYFVKRMNEDHVDKFMNKRYPYGYLNNDELLKYMDKIPKTIKPVTKISKLEFHSLMLKNSNRFEEKFLDSNVSRIKKVLIDSICDPDVVKSIKKSFLEKYHNNLR